MTLVTDHFMVYNTSIMKRLHSSSTITFFF